MSTSLPLVRHVALPSPLPLASPQFTCSAIAREAQYPLQRVAALSCVSFRPVQRHIRNHSQTTFTGWLEEHRMSEARRMILGGSSLKEVCFGLGYKQQSHFTRVFKKHFGMPPSLFSIPAVAFPEGH